ncbi:Spermidine synthase [gamma proteobacterium HdN1]|nr:Spermidine synthase [gamma proteobacterium HdN1]
MTGSVLQGFFTEIFAKQGTSFGLAIRRKLHEEQTRYQYLEVYETESFGNLLVLDGCIMLSGRDNFLYHEMMVHPAMFTHANPREVAIIGGGDCGTLREVLKHDSVERVVQVEIDEQVTRAAERFFPELTASNHDTRAQLLFMDGIEWIKTQPDASLDVILVDATDPIGPARELYETDFLSACQRVLREDGILVQQSESPLLHTDSLIQHLHKGMKAAGFAQVRTLLFPQPVYPSGWWSCTLASRLVNLAYARQSDIRNKRFPTEYYNLDTHIAAMAVPEFMRRRLEAE